MKTTLAILGILLQIFGTHSLLIVPDEIPTLLSVIYSNIPTIKKGTDSRFGWGFRLGDRADFQVLVELGPQTNTQPLANQGSTSSSKRNVANNLRNTLYAQQQERKKHISNTDGGKWIDQWREDMRNVPENQPTLVASKPGLGIGEIDAKSVIPDDSALMLRQLHRKKPAKEPETPIDISEASEPISTSLMLEKLYGKKIQEEEQEKSTTQKPKTTTSFKDALDNVDLE